jgi:prepilin-type N-terminal cleavage/methylation domain-containing protein
VVYTARFYSLSFPAMRLYFLNRGRYNYDKGVRVIRRMQNQGGYTLFELLVVTLIILILLTLLIVYR